MSKHYNLLKENFIKISNFSHLGAICSWDQSAIMPSGGNDARSAAMAELALHIHQLQNDERLMDWVSEAENESLSDVEKISLSEMKRVLEQGRVLPEDLVKAKSMARAKCEHAWRTQRGENDWAGFAENFKEVVRISQEEAKIRGEATGVSPYDAMMALYEPGVTSAQIDKVFEDVKSWLPALTDQIIEKQKSDKLISLDGQYQIDAQKALGQKVIKILGFDINHGRLDVSAHPFCGGVPSDVRMTTRYDENEFESAMMGIVHETGHACYEQGLPKEWGGLPIGEARSMGIHESQSLFFEMQIGRSFEFQKILSKLMIEQFKPNNLDAFSAENLHKSTTRVKRGFIRVDADEATYPAHVILRYEIERDLMNGKISYKDVPELWDQKMMDYLSIDTKGNYKNGVMQDVHWTEGFFGYFPSYTLGAMNAAQIKAAMSNDLDIAGLINDENLSPIFAWLKDKIWSKASSLSTDELMRSATGDVLDAKHFKAHLENRYL